MHKRIDLFIAALALISLTTFHPITTSAQTTSGLSVSPSSQSASVSNQAAVSINVANSPSAIVHQFTITYNPTYLSIASTADVTAGAFYSGGLVSTDLSQNTSGVAVISVSATTLAGSSGSGTVANIRFTTKSVNGTSNITLSNAFYGDLSFNQVNITSLTSGTITVSP